MSAVSSRRFFAKGEEMCGAMYFAIRVDSEGNMIEMIAEKVGLWGVIFVVVLRKNFV